MGLFGKGKAPSSTDGGPQARVARMAGQSGRPGSQVRVACAMWLRSLWLAGEEMVRLSEGSNRLATQPRLVLRIRTVAKRISHGIA
jgi:hypothetical protein